MDEKKIKLPNNPEVIVENITCLTKEQWLHERNTNNGGYSIGGSSVASIMGCGYETRIDIYNRIHKISMEERQLPEESIALGTKYEDEIARKYAELTKSTLIETVRMYRSSTHPFMIGDFDYFHINHKGEVLGLEIKYTDSNNFELINNLYKKIPPKHYEYQCRWYMAITGLPKWVLAIGWKKGNVSDGITDLAYVAIERDLRIEEFMIAETIRFLDETKRGIKPSLRKEDPVKALDAIKRSFSSKEDCIEISDSNIGYTCAQYIKLANQLAEYEEELKELQKEQIRLQAEIYQALEGHRYGKIATPFASFSLEIKTKNKTILDIEAIKALYPKEYEAAFIFNEAAFKKKNKDLLENVSSKIRVETNEILISSDEIEKSA